MDCYHQLCSELCTNSSAIVTVATIADGIVYKEYRDRYYVCDVFLRQCCESCGVVMAPGESQLFQNSQFLGGPVCWLFKRLAVLGEILLWPPARYYQRDGNWQFHAWETESFTTLIGRLNECASRSQIGALLLNLNLAADWRILLECSIAVSEGYRDFYISDTECRVAYVLHHHDMVKVSAPDAVCVDDIVSNLDALYPQVQNYSNF